MIMQASSTVQHHETLEGCATDQNVQIFVLSSDDKWYLQKRAVFHSEKRFTVECFFGNENTPPGTPFTVVAVITNKRPRSPMLDLPAGEQSPPITVFLG